MADDRPVVYAKGICPDEGGVGGCGAVVVVDGETTQISEGYGKTTVNRMSMRALILGLSALPRQCPVVYTDSRHIADAVNGGWARRWQARDWRSSRQGRLLKNVDLWRNVSWALADMAELRHIERGSDCAEMTRAEELAVSAAAGESLLADGYYEGEAHAAGRRPEGVSAFDEDAPAHGYS